jgi:OOP family OmpA-OmpF porin
MSKPSLFACLALSLLAGCSTQSGPTYTSHVISTSGAERAYRVSCTGLFESSKSCAAAAQNICQGQPVSPTQIVDGNDGMKPRDDPRELTFRCGTPPVAAMPPAPAQPPAPAAVPPVAQPIRPQPMQQTAVLFENDSTELGSEAQTRLGQFIAADRGLPISRVTVAGYTDSVGSVQANLRLSQARAAAVANYLKAEGLQAQQFSVRGFGSLRPVAMNADEDGRAQNRRAEVRVEVNQP